jgi:hypothetical protein
MSELRKILLFKVVSIKLGVVTALDENDKRISGSVHLCDETLAMVARVSRQSLLVVVQLNLGHNDDCGTSIIGHNTIGTNHSQNETGELSPGRTPWTKKQRQHCGSI